MSILIRGMEMPSCNDCPLAGDFKCNLMPSIPALCKEYDIAIQNGKRLDDCPLVEIPPHGRLIEKNAVFELIRSFPNVDRQLPVEFMKALYELPTIIEAEEGEK